MTPEKIKKEIKAALLALGDDRSLGYLAVTSKLELPVRDRVAWYLHCKHPDLLAAREYTVGSANNRKRRKKVDLALLKASQGPVALVEFKAMIVPDPLDNPRHPLMVSLRQDLKRLTDITPVSRLGVMLMVHIENVERLKKQWLDRGVVPYLNQFLRWANEPDALEKAIARASRFFHRAKLNVCTLTIKLGSVWGARVKLISFILEP